QIPYAGESLTFAELDGRAESVAAALSAFLTGPDQVVAVAMTQDNWQIVAAHLGILKAGGAMMFLDKTLPDALLTHMLNDAQPVVVLTRGQDKFRDLPTLDVLTLPERLPRREPPPWWLDDPTQRLATIFYTSGTTGMPKGVECPHAGYVNLALSYAEYFDLLPGMDATSLTSSLAYDGSISEMYSAWVSGCAVVMLTKEQVRSGPDLVSVLREAEVTVLFCPPVLLTTLTPTPELDLPYPLCRYIVPAGSPSQLDRHSPMSPTSSSWPTNSNHCPMGRLESSVSGECTLHAGTAICRTKLPRSSSRTLSSAAFTALGTNAKSTSKRSAYTSSAESTRSLKCVGIVLRHRQLRISSRRSSLRSRPPFWITRTRRSSPLSPRL